MVQMTFHPEGDVCSPQGFKASGVHCGLRRNVTKKDLALIVSTTRAAAAAVYTQNIVQSAPIAVTKRHLTDGYAQAVLCNSGKANTCSPGGVDVAEAMCLALERESGIAAEDVIVASTGIIGQPLPLEPILSGLPPLVDGLSETGGEAAACGIMTTDSTKKHCAVKVRIGGKTVTIGGIAKGSGMIHPNMATMLAFVTTDCAIEPAVLHRCLSADVADTFNMITVDGDTSTNDMLCIMANGQAENPVITGDGPDYDAFAAALSKVTTHLAKAIVEDGEGATKLLECRVRGAATLADARKAAKAVVGSDLVKTAMFGTDANWGRVLCALGYSGATLDPNGVAVAFSSNAGRVEVCRNGQGLPFSEEAAERVLREKEIHIEVDLADGAAACRAWGCDLSYDYVKISGGYRK